MTSARDKQCSAGSDLVNRLRSTAADIVDFHGKTMREWDEIRHAVETNGGSDMPRLMFEDLVEGFSELMVEAADALTVNEPQATQEMVADLVAALKYVAEFPINNSQRQHAQQTLGRFASQLTRPK
jgi:hypothetical protein